MTILLPFTYASFAMQGKEAVAQAEKSRYHGASDKEWTINPGSVHPIQNEKVERQNPSGENGL